MYAKSQGFQYHRGGFSDEKKVMAFLESQGNVITPSTPEENKYQDIDCYVNGVPVSIKAEHAGCKYRNVYFELENELTECPGTWEQGWYFTGTAQVYAILQGSTLRIYNKAAIQRYVNQYGWLRTCTLSPKVKATQGGTYRYQDTRIGVVNHDDIQHKAYDLNTGTYRLHVPFRPMAG